MTEPTPRDVALAHLQHLQAVFAIAEQAIRSTPDLSALIGQFAVAAPAIAAPKARPLAIADQSEKKAKTKKPRKPRVTREAAPEPAKPRPEPARPPADSANGVAVNLDEDNEAVTFRGQTMEVMRRQAELVAALAPAMPNPVDRAAVARKVWGSPPPSSADTMLGMLVTQTAGALAGIGLTVVSVRGVGIALREAQ